MSFENETFEASETVSAEPTAQYDRTAFGTLSKLANQPFEQASRLCKYLRSNRERSAKMVKLCSPAALEMAQKAHPELF